MMVLSILWGEGRGEGVVFTVMVWCLLLWHFRLGNVYGDGAVHLWGVKGEVRVWGDMWWYIGHVVYCITAVCCFSYVGHGTLRVRVVYGEDMVFMMAVLGYGACYDTVRAQCMGI